MTHGDDEDEDEDEDERIAADTGRELVESLRLAAVAEAGRGPPFVALAFLFSPVPVSVPVPAPASFSLPSS